VPVGYVFSDGRFYMPARRNSSKVLNLRADSRACIVIDEEQAEEGVMVQGTVQIPEGRQSKKKTYSPKGSIVTG
jgi:general stress protein 26